MGGNARKLSVAGGQTVSLKCSGSTFGSNFKITYEDGTEVSATYDSVSMIITFNSISMAPGLVNVFASNDEYGLTDSFELQYELMLMSGMTEILNFSLSFKTFFTNLT